MIVIKTLFSCRKDRHEASLSEFLFISVTPNNLSLDKLHPWTVFSSHPPPPQSMLGGESLHRKE